MSIRRYESPARRDQAERTRSAILAAGERLFQRDGFAETTIAQIAKEAGCSVARVYALFQSKAGILLALVTTSTFGPEYEKAVAEVRQTTDPAKSLRIAARIARLIYEAERHAFTLLRGGSLVSDELSERNQELEDQRFRLQEPVIVNIAEQGALADGLSVESARARLWVLTSREIFRGLIGGKGWSADEYEDWLGNLLIADLLS